MLSAPVAIPATIESTFAAAFAPTDPASRSRRRVSVAKPASRAIRSNGTNPAFATTLRSSQIADTLARV